MAGTNPTYGPIPRAAFDDPNGYPGQTRGGVSDRLAQEPPAASEPNAGSFHRVPPFLANPTRTPLADVYDSTVPPLDGE